MSQHSVQFNEDKRHAVYARDGYRCAYCGRHDETKSGAGLSLDHIQSREEGGEGQAGKNEPATNLVTACGPCNSSKQALTPRAYNAMLKAQGKSAVDWRAVRAQAQRPIDIKVGEQNAAKAATYRAEVMKRLGVTNVKQLSSIAGRGELQERLAAHAKETGATHGPGVCHDEQGHFVACRRAVVQRALALAALLRARLASER
jgi:hypothetical protein